MADCVNQFIIQSLPTYEGQMGGGRNPSSIHVHFHFDLSTEARYMDEAMN